MNEFDLIKKLESKTKGIGDDCAVLNPTKKQVYSTDALVEGVHFDLSYFSLEQVGKKLVVQNVSDVFAMGAKPHSLLVSVITPNTKQVDRIYEGIFSKAKEFGVDIVGGNIARGTQLVLSATILGSVARPIYRKGARVGDLICINKEVGRSALGFELLRKTIKGYSLIKRAHLEPQTLGLKSTTGVHAMIDVSDGLVQDLAHICTQSEVGATLFADSLPLTKEFHDAAVALKMDPINLALSSGEEFAMLYTINKKKLKDVGGVCIGRITKQQEMVIMRNARAKKIFPKGFDHFR